MMTMQPYLPIALVTLLAALLCFWMATRVAGARRKVGIAPPVMTGDPVLERTIRAHLNTLEWLPVFVLSLWIFAIYWDVRVATALGAVWLVGRVVYFLGYVAEVKKRQTGFLIQALAAGTLLFGALGRVLYLLVT